MESKTLVISKSNKMRSGSFWVVAKGGLEKKKDGIMRHWKQVVIKTPIGKNSKGVEVFSSKTKHVPV